MPTSWTDKLRNGRPHQVKPVPINIAGMKTGQVMLVPSPQLVDAFIRRYGYCGTPRVIRCVISVSAFPTSICPHEMSYLRPSSEVDLVRPVTACLAVV